MEIKFIKKYSLFKKEEIRPASIGAALLFSFCQYLLIETGIRNPFAGFEPVSILYICAGVFDLLYLNLILTLLTGRKSAAFAVTTVAALVLSLVNHYTWLLHGEPFRTRRLFLTESSLGETEPLYDPERWRREGVLGIPVQYECYAPDQRPVRGAVTPLYLLEYPVPARDKT